MTDFDRASAPGYFDDVPTTTTNRTTTMDNQQKPLSERAARVWLLDHGIPRWVLDEIAALEARLTAAEAEIRTDEYTIADLNHQIEGFKGRIAELERTLLLAQQAEEMNARLHLEAKHRAESLQTHLTESNRQLEDARKDAERYRWLRTQNWDEADLCVVAYPRNAVKLGHDCPSLDRLDDAIDAAMTEEAGHD